MKRLTYLDWLRGVAVVIMINWHAMDAWTAASFKRGPVWDRLALLGGWAAPFFLFLAGLAVALGGAAKLRKMDRRAASWALQKRGWQIFLLAHVFRLQAFLLNPGAPWSSLLKPDILNILGLGLVAAAWSWGRDDHRWRRALWLLLPAVIVLLLTPGSRVWHWPAWFQSFAPRFEAYIRPMPGLGVFSLFPWLAFVFVGAWMGDLITASRAEGGERRLQLTLAALGVGLAVAGTVGIQLPPLDARSSFWTTSLSFFLIRIGVMTAAIPLAWLWMQRPTAHHWSPLVLFGQTSLFVYWVHVELAYGVLSYPLHGRFSLQAAFIAYAIFTAGMLGLAVVWRRKVQEKALGSRL